MDQMIHHYYTFMIAAINYPLLYKKIPWILKIFLLIKKEIVLLM